MTDNSDKKNKLYGGIKFWYKNFKKRWISYTLKIFLYLVPFSVVLPSISEFIIKHFFSVIFMIVLVFIINESIDVIAALKNEQTIKNLKNKNKELERKYLDIEHYSESIGLYLEKIPKEFLRNVSKFLDLKNSERISLYVLSEDKFSIIGRYSENPTYHRKGRESYPVECGYIAKCLSNDNGKDYFIRTGLPAKQKAYIEIVSKETGMSEDEIKSLSMSSKSYFTRVIKDEKNKNVGILVVESTKSKFTMNAEEMESKLKELSVHHMSTLLEISNKLKRSGF